MKKSLLIIGYILTSLSLLAQGTLLVANKNDHTVSIIDLNNNKETSRIEVGKGPHEVAVSPDGKVSAIANYGNKATISNSITIIDIVNRQKVKEIDLGDFTRPHGIEFINNKELLATSETKQALIKVEIETGTITLVARTEQALSHMVAYSKRDQKAYVANIASGTVSLIDVNKNILVKQLPFKKGIEGITVSPDGSEVWVANREDSTVTAMSTKTFELLGIMPAHQVAYRIKYLANAKYVVVSNGMTGNVSIYDARKKKHIKDIDVKDRSRTHTEEQPNMPVPVGIASSIDSHYIFVSLAGYNQVAVIRTKDWVIEKTIAVGNGPDGIYYSKID